MSVLYLHFDSGDRSARVQKLARSGAHVLVSEPRWPDFYEIAKKEKPYAIAIDFSSAPSHALETADYLAKAKETRDARIFLLRVPEDRLEAVKRRLPQAPIVTEQELSEQLAQAEKEAQERAREKKEAAAQARKTARAKKTAEKSAGGAKQPAGPRKSAPAKKTPAQEAKRKPAPTKKKRTKSGASRPPKKK